MLLNTIEITNYYPNEEIKVYFNEIANPIDNARLGVRFRYFYYNTLDNKINFKQTPEYTLVSNNIAGGSISATFPTNFVNPAEFTPFKWDVASDREYLYLTLLGGASGLTVWPSHPYPRITKNSDYNISVDIGVVSAAAFEGEYKTPQFRKFIKQNGFSNVNFDDSLITTTKQRAYTSKTRKNYQYAQNANFFNTFNSTILGQNIIPNSFQIDIPVVINKSVIPDQENQIFTLSFFNDTYTNTKFNTVSAGVTYLTCLSSETLCALGIPFPYTVPNGARMSETTGGISIAFNSPLFINKYDNITVSYETSSPVNAGIQFTSLATNNYNVSVNPVTFANYPIYLFNYQFTDNTQDLLTVSFQPSSYVTSSTISSVDVNTVMIDNYYQNSFAMPVVDNLLQKRFIETTGDTSLSAFDPAYPGILYSNNQWFPANRKTRFINDGNGNKHSVRIQLKSIFDSIFEENSETTFILNKDKIFMNLSLKDVTESSATSNVVIFPTPSENYKIKWSADPPENIVFKNLNDEIIPSDTLISPDYFATISNFGVDKTEITLYSEEYDLSASTFWFPPSSVTGNISLRLVGNVSDNDERNYGTLSALCVRNGYTYRVPTDANIIWNETANDTRGNLQFFAHDFKEIKESTIYGSTDKYALINPVFSASSVTGNPKRIVFNVSCNLFRNDFDLNATKIFTVRQYPDGAYLTMNAKKSSDTKVYNSETYTNVIYTSAGTISLSAIHPRLTVAPANLQWKSIKSNGTITTGTGENFNLNFNTISACVTLSGISAKPVDGNFEIYNFSDKICFYNLSTIQPLDYIGFPSNKYTYPQTALSFNNYTESDGMSAYRPCHTETFNLSTFGGFDKYFWQIGSKIVESNSNKISIPVTFSDISASNTISISAYNSIFSEYDPVTIYNSTSSNSINKYKEPVRFLDFPLSNISITSDSILVDTSRYSTMPNIKGLISHPYTVLKGSTFNIVVSSYDNIQYKQIQNTADSFSKILTFGTENVDFIISENSFNPVSIYLSGNAEVTLDGYDYCSSYQPISSNTLNITAYNGPQLDLYAEKNILSTTEPVIFYNNSNSTFANNYYNFASFIFDNGEGEIQTTTSPILSTSYLSDGVKSPTLTGILYNGDTKVQSWKNLIFVKTAWENYDSTITREFNKPISLPYALEDILVSPNDWQYANNINVSLEKVYTNIAYLSAMTNINNLNFPKAYGGFLGSRLGNFKWHTLAPATGISDTIFSNIKFAQIVDDKLIIINNSAIDIYQLGNVPTLLYTISRIGDGEILENPTKLHYDSDSKRIYILDNEKHLMLVCDFDIDIPSNIILTHYWGGFGEKSDRTKLNNPTDFCLDSEKNLYIVDKDSNFIKVYNKNLNWIRNISADSPNNIDYDHNQFLVSTSANTYTIDNYGNTQNTFNVTGNTIFNKLHRGILYTITGNQVSKYSANGTFITSKTYNDSIVNIIFDQYHGYLIFPTYIIKFVDFIEIDRLINTDESFSGFSEDSIYVDQYEFVTDYIYNDSFKKLYDNTYLLNSRILKNLQIDMNEYGTILNQYSSSYTAPAISSTSLIIGNNEPVLYDTINRSFESLYDGCEQLKNNLDVVFNYPSESSIKWRWKYHYVDDVQRPSLDKTPISWYELKSANIVGNTALSSISSWCYIREGIGGNHSQICWNFEQTQSNSYFPLTWESTELSATCGHPNTWENAETECCASPDLIFANCLSAC
jgi:hypothetical protein